MGPLIVVGFVAGSVYALAGIGLTLTYKTSGIFNFAFGGMATLGAFVFYTMRVEHGVSWPLAALVAVVGLGTLSGVLLERLGRRLSRTSMAWRIGATLGLQIIIQSSLSVHYGAADRTFPHFLPTETFRVLGVRVTYEQLIVVGVSLSAAAGLFVMFRLTRIGTAMRAVVADADLLGLTGTNPQRVRRFAWVIGSSFAMLAGVLLAPHSALDPYSLSLLIIQALGAAAFGGFSNLFLVWVGGIVIGVASALISHFFPTGFIAAVGASLPFVVLFVVLMVAPRARLETNEPNLVRRTVSWMAPVRAQIALGMAVLAFLAVVPTFAGYLIGRWTIILTNVILLLSLGFLVRVAGQVSLCQVSFAAIGAGTFSQLTHGFGLLIPGVHLPGFHLAWLPGLLLCGIVVVPIGALLSIPALRLSGLYLALTTFAFGILQDQLFPVNGRTPPPDLPGLHTNTPTGLYYVVLIIATVITVVVVVITRTRLGRLLRGVADAPRALTVSGTAVPVTVVLAFCISAYIAAIAGALSSMTFGSAIEIDFNPTTSIFYLLLAMVALGGTPWYALIGALAVGLVPIYFNSPNSPYYLQILVGAGVIVTAILNPQAPLLLRIQGVIERLAGPRPTKRRQRHQASSPTPPPVRVKPASLQVQGIAVHFGGLMAVDDFSFEVHAGQIIGLIGPNGSGKTTTLNVCSGLVRSSSGAVLLDGRNVARVRTARRALEGLGRTFQQMELFESMTVAANVALGCEAKLAGRSLAAHVITTRHDRDVTITRVQDALALCHLEDLANTHVAALPGGQRRLVELARCLAGDYRILLLDEPSSGLDRAERQRFVDILKRSVSERGVGVLLVEHDMELVMTICDEIYVMTSGRLINHGTPEEVQADQAVAEAYFGTGYATPT